MATITRQLLNWSGSGLALLGVVFVGFRLHGYAGSIDLSALGCAQYSAVVGVSLVYAVANLLLAVAWWHLLAHLGCSVSRRWAVRTYGVAQLAKYVPGNIFHLAGRQAIGVAAGLPAGVLIRSTIWELLLIALAGGSFVALVIPVVWQNGPIYAGPLLWMSSVAIVVCAACQLMGRGVAWALLLQVLFLLVSSFVFVGLFELLETPALRSAVPLSLLAGAYVVAWLVGLVTPGAPAGVGVRELVLLLILKGAVSEADLLLTVVLGRAVTVLGDLAFFTMSLFIVQTSPGQENQ